jgi:S-formylglutathione hydrolase FrmB
LVLAGFGFVGSGASAHLPTAGECAGGQAEPVTVGNHVGSAGACLAAGGHVGAYAAGNVAIPCGSVAIADQALFADDPDMCDSLLDMPVPDRLEYDVVLPSGYASSGRSYPTLYLLTSGFVDEWPSVDPNLQAVADLGMILVLPARGLGFYNDWENGQHKFETLYTRTLIDDVDTRYRTIADRTQRALAGVSKAGYGAVYLAARHPDLYGAAASLSGLVNIARPEFPAFFTAQMQPGLATYADPTAGVDHPIFGHPVTNLVSWHNRNPTDLVTNLRGVAVYASAGDGVPTADELAGDGPTIALGTYTEAEIRVQSDDFDAALTAADIPHTYVQRSGTHNFRFWVPELHALAPTLMEVFADPVATPEAFDYRTADPGFSVWGWSFRVDATRAREFMDVRDVSARGFAVTGSGRLTVLTAPVFAPRQRVLVKDDAGGSLMRTADRLGRLELTVDLGAPHQTQQYTPAALVLEADPGYFTTRSVTFTPVGPRR